MNFCEGLNYINFRGVFKTQNGAIEHCPNQQIKANCKQTGVKANYKQTGVKPNCKH